VPEREVAGAVGAAGSLVGLAVAVTRPAGQADALVARLEAAGARVIRFPVLAIAEATDPRPAQALMEHLERFHLAIFTSPNAVDRGMALVRSCRSGVGLPAGLRLAAVGAATARSLAELGLQVAIQPQRAYSSEALLAMPALQREQIAGRAVLIVRGEGGRELLVRELSERGAQVDCAVVYRRVRPRVEPEVLLGPARRGEVGAVIVTSGEGLRNLFDLVGAAGREWLYEAPLVVLSERIATLAREHGVRRAPVVAACASDEALVDAVRRAGGRA
jgi:uroporphyrinogen-III synthase